MHFRIQGKRLQCIATIYDAEKKGPRQVLVWSCEENSVAPGPQELRSGTVEQREKWASEIAERLNGVETNKDNVTLLVELLERMSEEEKRTAVEKYGDRLAAVWVPNAASVERVKRDYSGQNLDDSRAFGAELVAIAKQLRAEGKSIANTAEIMTAMGFKVSASWVQKWTSSS